MMAFSSSALGEWEEERAAAIILGLSRFTDSTAGSLRRVRPDPLLDPLSMRVVETVVVEVTLFLIDAEGVVDVVVDSVRVREARVCFLVGAP